MDNNFWQGQSIRLRAVEPEDAEFFYRLNLDSEMARCLDFVWTPSSLEMMRHWAAEQALKRLENDAFFWVIVNASGEPVGTISTHNCRPRNGTFSYGVSIAAAHRHKGYASQAIRLVLRYYFEELRYQKCTVNVNADNPASAALHRRLGFIQEGELRRMMFTRGEYLSVLYFGITVEEWRASPRDSHDG